MSRRKTLARFFPIFTLFFVLFLLLWVTEGNAAIYSYRDEKGRLYLTDNPPNKKYKIIVTTHKERAEPDLPDQNYGSFQILSEIQPQKILLPNDETFSTYINQAARENGLDPYLIKAVVKVESDFDPNAVSSKGAQGLMQLIPSTARLVGCTDPFDPVENIKGGAKYLRMMLDRFGWNLPKALAAYNSGPSRVEQYGGVPPYRETQNYVKKVQYYYQKYRSGLPDFKPIYSNSKKTTKSVLSAPSALNQKLIAAYRLYQNQDIEGAIRAYQDILNIYPRNTQALYNLACLLDYERRYDEAIDAYKAALREDPYLDKALYNLAIIYERLGQHQEAIATWRNYMLATKDEEKIIMAERYVKELEEYAALGR